MGSFRAVLVAAILAQAAGLALAGPTEAQKAQASELVKKAIAKSQAGDHAAAIDLYRQAYALVPVPVLLSNIGNEYQQSSKPVEALKSFCDYLQADPTGANASYAKAQAKTLAVQLGRSADGDPCAPPPATPPDAGAGPGGGASTGVGTAPPDLTAPTAGVSAHATEAPRKSPLIRTGYVVGGVGVVAFGAGVYFAVDGKNISDFISNYTDTHPGMAWPKDIQDRQKRGERDNTLQVAFMIAGGAAVATGITMILLGHRHGSAEHVAIVPIATPTSAGLAAVGRF